MTVATMTGMIVATKGTKTEATELAATQDTKITKGFFFVIFVSCVANPFVFFLAFVVDAFVSLVADAPACSVAG